MGGSLMEYELSRKEHKPLQVNPIKHSQPMGAALAYMGIKNCLPLMHASQGCASYTKETRDKALSLYDRAPLRPLLGIMTLTEFISSLELEKGN